ncbi:MAG: M20/M25/M40 family metallo-hydrolase [Blastocatellia bacterium]
MTGRNSALVYLFLISIVTSVSTPAAPLQVDRGSTIFRLIAAQGVTGYEGAVRKTVRESLPSGLHARIKEDNAGNLVLVFGDGAPSTVIAAPMDEVGYTVSEIRDDGYLRLNRVGRGLPSRLWDQFYGGQPVVIGTDKGLVPGVTACLSVHLQPGRINPAANRPLTLDDLWVDVGASSRAQAPALGIRLLDPVALRDRATALAGGRFAGIAAANRGGCAALISLASVLEKQPPANGSVVLAWLAQEWFGRKGSDRLSHEFHPDKVIMLDSSMPSFPAHGSDRTLGISGVLGEGPILSAGARFLQPVAEKLGVAYQKASANDSNGSSTLPGAFKANYTGGPDWGKAEVEVVELPAAFSGSVVETVCQADVDRLVELLAGSVGVPEHIAQSGPTPTMNEPLPDGETRASQVPDAALLKKLIETSSVSGTEGRMRETVTKLLPSWAKPRTDEGGNLIVDFGKGKPYKVFLAHMDEIGFQVNGIRPDGMLIVEERGFGYPRLYQGHLAVVHLASGADVPGVMTPEPGYHETQRANRPEPEAERPARGSPAPATFIYVGAASRAEAEALGIHAGDTVTIPKHFQLLADGRATGRSIDDRNGCAALLAAIRSLDPAKVHGRVTFVWSTREETGLEGAKYYSEHMTDDPDFVFGVDTFVSSDSPIETDRFADAPLGRGAVIRALDNSNVAPPKLVQEVLEMAASRSIALQYGVTGGGNDGAVFTRLGAINIPLAWPLRYSHSPAELIDLRDLQALSSLVRLLTEDFTGSGLVRPPVRKKPAAAVK